MPFFFLQQFFKKLNIELPYDLTCPLLGIYPKELKTRSHKNLYMNVHGSIIQDNHREEATQCLSVDELINKMWSAHTMEYYYSAIKRNEADTC